MRYVSAFDGIRAFCVLLVVCHHTQGKPWWINGTVGVDIFFALSGFLITTLLLRERAETGTISLRSFYIRRVFRIVPLYYLTIFLYLPSVWVTAFVVHDTSGVSHFNDALPWLATFNSELRGAAGGNLFGHAWTLGIEEKFYLLWPLAMMPVLALGKRALLLIPLLLVFLPSHFMFRGYAGIVCGVTMAALVEQHHWRGFFQRVPTSLWLVPLAVAYALTLLVANDRINVLIAASAAFLIASLANRESGVNRFLSTQPLPFLGVLTYAIYLTHRLVGNAVETGFRLAHFEQRFWLEVPLVYGLTVAVAFILHVRIEAPLIPLRQGVGAIGKGGSVASRDPLWDGSAASTQDPQRGITPSTPLPTSP